MLSHEHILTFLFSIYFRYELQSITEAFGFEGYMPIDRQTFEFLSIAIRIQPIFYYIEYNEKWYNESKSLIHNIPF